MIGSTKAGLKLNTRQFDLFNQSLVEQIKPHIKSLDLAEELLKFTGDGWLLMTDQEKHVPSLCCLATIMAHKFQDDMVQKTSIPPDKIPALRLAVCAGRDIRVVLPDGRTDWIGDSARRAVRATQFCEPQQILIDESIRYHVLRDFDIKPKDIDESSVENTPKKSEEIFVLHILGPLKTETAADSKNPEYFVYTFDVIGNIKKAQKVAQKVSKRLEKEAAKMPDEDLTRQNIIDSWNQVLAALSDYPLVLEIFNQSRNSAIRPTVITYNILMNKAPNYETVKTWLETMRQEGVTPTVVTYNTLVNQAPDYESAKGWLETIRKEGIQPDVFTYSTLIKKAPDYETAKGCLETMRQKGITPDVVTYSTLADKAPEYETTMYWLATMRQEGLQPNVFTYNTLADKSPDYETAKRWLETMIQDGIQPNLVTYNTLVDKAQNYDSAKVLLERMHQEGILPDVYTYSILVGKAQNYDLSKELVETMIREGIQPNIVTYQAMFSKDLTDVSAEVILKWYFDQEYHPEEPIQTAIAKYRKSGNIDQALRLALEYPHLLSARKLIRQNSEQSLQYFKSIFDDNPQHPNAAYALGIAFFDLGDKDQARFYLIKAQELATGPERKETIKAFIDQIDSGDIG